MDTGTILTTKMYVFFNAASIAVFNGNLEYNRASLHQMCEAQQCTQARYLWEPQCYSTIALWCKYNPENFKFTCVSVQGQLRTCKLLTFKFLLLCRECWRPLELVVLVILLEEHFTNFFFALVFLHQKFWRESKSFFTLVYQKKDEKECIWVIIYMTFCCSYILWWPVSLFNYLLLQDHI